MNEECGLFIVFLTLSVQSSDGQNAIIPMLSNGIMMHEQMILRVVAHDVITW
jgi:hypothetical protein